VRESYLPARRNAQASRQIIGRKMKMPSTTPKVLLLLTAMSLFAAMFGIFGFATIGTPGDGGIRNPIVAACAMVAHGFYVGLFLPLGFFAGPLRLPETLPFFGTIIVADAVVWTVAFWVVGRWIRKRSRHRTHAG
jgi:hypothetical protein